MSDAVELAKQFCIRCEVHRREYPHDLCPVCRDDDARADAA